MSEHSEEQGATGAGAEQNAAAPADQINVRVVNQEGMEVYFKIRKSTPLRRLMEAYCNRQGLQTANVRFLYDGERLKDDATPEALSMEDNDVIDAVAQQTGGAAAALH